MNADDDHLVADYLRQLRAAATALPADRADELIEEITSHIAEARGGGPAGLGDSPSVRNILERLGDPADIVRSAAEPGFGEVPAGRAAGGRRGGSSPGALEVSAVILLLLGGIVVPVVGWLVGVVLLWASPRWRTREKVLGTLVWPGGLLAPVALVFGAGVGGAIAVSVTACAPGASVASINATTGQQTVHHLAANCTTTAGPPAWLVIVIAGFLMGMAIAGPIFTAVRLLRRVAGSPAEPAADPAALQTV
jgi:hypothetical protein